YTTSDARGTGRADRVVNAYLAWSGDRGAARGWGSPPIRATSARAVRRLPGGSAPGVHDRCSDPPRHHNAENREQRFPVANLTGSAARGTGTGTSALHVRRP